MIRGSVKAAEFTGPIDVRPLRSCMALLKSRSPAKLPTWSSNTMARRYQRRECLFFMLSGRVPVSIWLPQEMSPTNQQNPKIDPVTPHDDNRWLHPDQDQRFLRRSSRFNADHPVAVPLGPVLEAGECAITSLPFVTLGNTATPPRRAQALDVWASPSKQPISYHCSSPPGDLA